MKKAGRFRTCIIFMALVSVLAQTRTAYSAALTGADTVAPTAPAEVTVANKAFTSISICWSKSQDNKEVKGYQVYRDGRKLITVSRTSYTVTGLIPGREYVFTIRAYDAAGNLSDSSAALCAAAVSDLQPPTAPGTLSASAASYTSITLRWRPSSDNTSIKGYEVYCNGGRKASTAATSYECKGLEPGKSYSFFIKAYDIAGNYSIQSNKIYYETLTDAAAPSVPEGLKASSVAGTEINLSWSPSSDNVKVKGYEVFCDGIRKGKISKTAYSCKGLIPGKSYSFTVKALDIAGNFSGLSRQLKVTTAKDLEAPTAPTGLKVKAIKSTGISLEWTASTDNIKVKGYKIYCNGIEVATSTRTERTVKISKGLGINILWVKAYDLADNISAGSKSVTVLGP